MAALSAGVKLQALHSATAPCKKATRKLASAAGLLLEMPSTFEEFQASKLTGLSHESPARGLQSACSLPGASVDVQDLQPLQTRSSKLAVPLQSKVTKATGPASRKCSLQKGLEACRQQGLEELPLERSFKFQA